MMIQLLAIAPEDGWAFARSGESLYLLRPPYDKRRHQLVDEGSVERAVAVEGFEAADQAFSSWAALFAHLKEVTFSSRPPLPAALAPATVERILRHAPPFSLALLLDRIEHDLLPNRQWDAASGLLARFLIVESPALAGLRSRAADLLDLCNQARAAATEKRERLALEVMAPLAVAKYGLESLRQRAQSVREVGFFPG